MMERPTRTYPAPWQGRLILACRKCQKKLKKEDGFKALSNLRKVAKLHNKRHPESLLHILSVPCMDLCPKHAVAICVPSESPDRLQLLRMEQDLARVVS